jgi:hypothetical protein
MNTRTYPYVPRSSLHGGRRDPPSERCYSPTVFAVSTAIQLDSGSTEKEEHHL